MNKLRLPIVFLLAAIAAGVIGYFYAPVLLVSLLLVALAVVSMLQIGAKITSQEDERREAQKTIMSTKDFDKGVEKSETNTPSDLSQTHLGTDPETGLSTFPVFKAILEAKVATARRRLWPVTIVQIQLSFIDQATPSNEEIASSIISFASLLRLTLREADVVARIGDYRFGLILEDTDEEGSAWVAERVQVAQIKAGSTIVHKISAGVAGYPTNGAAPQELFGRSTLALEHALAASNEPGIGKVIVAPTVPYRA